MRWPPAGAGLQPFHLFGSPRRSCIRLEVRCASLGSCSWSRRRWRQWTATPLRHRNLEFLTLHHKAKQTASSATINTKEQRQKTKCVCELFACRGNLCYSITSYFLVCLPLYCGPKSLSPVLCAAMFGCSDFTNLGPAVYTVCYLPLWMGTVYIPCSEETRSAKVRASLAISPGTFSSWQLNYLGRV